MSKPAPNFVFRRKAEKLSQAGIAKKLGVTPNTVARWERGEIPIPHWVSQLQALEDTHADEIAKLKQEIASLKQDVSFKDLTIGVLKTEVGLLKLGIPTERSLPRSAKEFHRKLSLRFHPDRNPAHAETMRSINEIYQSLER